jgi:hypothetical protein
MASTALRPILREQAGRKAKPARASRAVERVGRQALIDKRDRCMAEIAHCSDCGGPADRLFDKARQLLTRHWSVSPWRSRADILRTAEWLIGVGRNSLAAEPSREMGAAGALRSRSAAR